MQMRPEAVPGAADVADHLPLRDGLPVRDGDARLVRIARREPAPVIDEDEVAVAVHPARVDDLARGSGVDGRAVSDSDVDPGVHPAPAHPERARHRAVDRPDETARRPRSRWTVGRCRLGRLDLRAEGRAHLLERLGFPDRLAFARPDLPEADPFRRAGRDELLPAGHQLVADRTHLLGPGLYGPRLGGNDPSEVPRTRSRLPRRALGAADAGGDRLVCRPDLVDVIEAVDEVGEAAGAEDHVDRVDVTVLVDLDQPGVQARERERILPAEEEVPLRLEPEECRQSVELAAVKNQNALERRQADQDVADAALEPVEPRVDAVESGRERL